MTKDIKQIQEENRKVILEAILGTHKEVLNNNNLSPQIKGNYSSLPITLSRVLKVLGDNDEYLEFNPCLGVVKTWDRRGSETDNIILFKWDLEIETLEQQEPKVQIAINQLLTK